MWFPLSLAFRWLLNQRQKKKEKDEVEWEFLRILHRWHSNCRPTSLYLCAFYSSLSRSRISHSIHHVARQDRGLTFSFTGSIISPLCHSSRLPALKALCLSLLPPNLCRQTSQRSAAWSATVSCFLPVTMFTAAGRSPCLIFCRSNCFCQISSFL